MKSYMDSLFDPTCVPVRVTINKLNFFPNRKMPLTGKHWYTCRVKEAIHIRLSLSIEIVESKFQKLGYLRSESTTADQPQSGPVREQHSNSRNNNEDRNAPIAANHHATNSDT